MKSEAQSGFLSRKNAINDYDIDVSRFPSFLRLVTNHDIVVRRLGGNSNVVKAFLDEGEHDGSR